MSHSKMCPFFSSQAWAASHNAPGAQAPHLAGLSAEAGLGNTFTPENLACNKAFQEHGNCPRERMASCINMLKRQDKHL